VAGLVPATPIVWLSVFTIEVAGTSPAMTLRRLFYVIDAQLNSCPVSKRNPGAALEHAEAFLRAARPFPDFASLNPGYRLISPPHFVFSKISRPINIRRISLHLSSL